MASSKKLFEIEAEIRHELGKGASRRLRREKKLPGVVYGGGKESISLTFEHKNLVKSLENEAFYSHILTLKIGNESEHVVLKDMQRHPYKSQIVHIDLLRVKADEKLIMNIPLHIIGGDKAKGVKAGGIVSHIESDVEVSCFPDKLPEFIEIDISDLGLNEVVHLSEIKLPEGVELVALSHGDDRGVVGIHPPRAEEEPEMSAAPQASEVPAIAQKSEETKK